jgi:CheY-like chemotaxis protein
LLWRFPSGGSGENIQRAFIRRIVMAKTILFVDDEQWLMEGMVDGLEAYGYRVICAANGTQALELIEENDIDLVLLDIMMPPGGRIEDATYGRRTGVELCRILREEMELKIPILCLTVVTDSAVHNELRKYGAVVRVKPALPSEIAALIEDLT